VHSRARIVAEARLIADEEGLEALTLRRLATRLEAGQASLYRHVADRGELLASPTAHAPTSSGRCPGFSTSCRRRRPEDLKA
jgi:hypothetical protein